MNARHAILDERDALLDRATEAMVEQNQTHPAIAEHAITFGDGLFGFLTRPPHNVAAGSEPRPTVLLLNAGLIHRSGPFRLHTHLARELAKAGHAVLRFDLPGVGDAAFDHERAQSQIVVRIMDRLQRVVGSSGFIVGGICSAADLGWRVAVADQRVRGVILLDGVARKGFWFHVGQAQLFLRRSPRRWFGMLARRIAPAKTQLAARASDDDLREWPTIGHERDELAQLVARGTRVLALYTGGVATYFLHRRQFLASFGSAAQHPNVQFDFWPECDHLFMAAGDRVRLRRHIGNWCIREFANADAEQSA
ncbi:MAG: alpha/beta fold hydrolase [Dokdonella sp.]